MLIKRQSVTWVYGIIFMWNREGVTLQIKSAVMKKLSSNIKELMVSLLLLVVVVACKSGDSTADNADTAQTVPGLNDSVPSVVNPGTGDTSGVMTTPPTNDNNTIMPDSTTIAQ